MKAEPALPHILSRLREFHRVSWKPVPYNSPVPSGRGLFLRQEAWTLVHHPDFGLKALPLLISYDPELKLRGY